MAAGERRERSAGDGDKAPSPIPGLVAILAVALAGLLMWRAGAGRTDVVRVEYSTFYDLAKEGKVSRVTFDGRDVEAELKAPEVIQGTPESSFRSTLPERDDSLLPLLHDEHVRIDVRPAAPEVLTTLVVGFLPWLLLIGVWVWSSRRGPMSLRGPFEAFAASRAHRFERSDQVKVTFDDVAGCAGAKRDLREVVDFLKEPERFRRLGCKAPRGVLLVGPPGTGKTLLARAVAGESSVPFFSISASEFIEMFVGVGAARVRDLFERAKKDAPSIVFIDELDAVGRSRGTGLGGGHDEREQTLNQLLSEMDGFTRNDLIVVLSATNRPDVLDPALLRPGRFDRRVVVDRPELEARRSILAVHTRKTPLAADVDLDEVAHNTPGFSGADLENLVNEAALAATRRRAESVGREDFAAAFDKVLLGDPREGRLDPEEKRRVAVHESGHAVVAFFAGQTEPPRRVSIIPRGMSLGATQQTPGIDRHILTQPELDARLSVLLGGYAAELSALGHVSTGAENDLKEATHLATKMVANYGMSKTLGPVYYEREEEHPFLGHRVATAGGASDVTIAAVEQETRTLLANAVESATALVRAHRAAFDRLVTALLEKEVVEKDELRALLDEATVPASEPPLAAE